MRPFPKDECESNNHSHQECVRRRVACLQTGARSAESKCPSTFQKLEQHTITPIFHMSILYPHFIPSITSGALYRSGPAFRVFWTSPLSADPKSERTGSPPVGHLNRREAYTILSPTCLRGEGFSSSCLTKLSRTELSSKFNNILLALMSRRVQISELQL